MKRIPTDLHARARALAPGVLACAVVAAAAAFLSGHYGAPVMLFALLLGLAMNFLATDGPCAAGIEFTARTVLRVGIALLGLRITFGQVQAMGWQPVALVVGSMALTIGLSMAVARLMGFQAIFGLLTGGATAICGASAALALSAALPVHPLKERATLFTVIGVSALSTLAMIVYPLIARLLNLPPELAGLFLGGLAFSHLLGTDRQPESVQRARGAADLVAVLLVVLLRRVRLHAAPKEQRAR